MGLQDSSARISHHEEPHQAATLKLCSSQIGPYG